MQKPKNIPNILKDTFQKGHDFLSLPTLTKQVLHGLEYLTLQ